MEIYMRGRWLDPEKATLSPFNSAVFYGESLFEAIPLYGGKPLFLRDHLQRLGKGCRFLGWSAPGAPEVRRILSGLARRWKGNGNFIVRLGLVQEMGPQAGPRTFSKTPPVLFAAARPLRHDPDSDLPPSGRVGLAKWKLPSPAAYPYGFKTTFYLTARREIGRHPEWDEMLRVSEPGKVVDGFSSSPILFQGNRVLASAGEAGGLESVTQSRILAFCDSLGYKVLRKTWEPRDVFKKRSELIFVGSGIGVFAASRFQGRSLGKPGPAAMRMWRGYQSWIKKCASSQ